MRNSRKSCNKQEEDDITNNNNIVNFLINYKINRYKDDMFIGERKQKDNTQVSISIQRFTWKGGTN